jgi:hypothetical protein
MILTKLSFKQFVLIEKMVPKYIDYGTDFVNKEWKQLDSNFYVTFFRSNENSFCVLYRDGYVGFATNYRDDEQTILEHIKKVRTAKELSMKYHFTRKPINNVYSVFKYVFFIITEAINKFKPNRVLFDGNDDLLREFYQVVLDKSTVKEELKNMNFVYKGIVDTGVRKFFTFEKE